MTKLPEGVAVILIYKVNQEFCKTSKRTSYEAIINGYEALNASNRECRIYPINANRQVNLCKAVITLAWREAMTLQEFKEYLDD